MSAPFLSGNATPQAMGYESAMAVTPSASQLVPPNLRGPATKGLMVGGAGNLVVTMADGTGPITIPIPATACGVMLPLAVTYVLAATTATGINAFY